MFATGNVRRRVSIGTLLGAAVVASVISAGTASAAPQCFGATATIVGTARGETLRGTAGRDVIVARGGEDVVVARAGNDLVCAGGGDDEVSAGTGNDKVNGGEESVGDKLLGERGKDNLLSGGGSFYDYNHGDVVRGGRGADVLEGTAQLDYLYGGAGADTLETKGSTDPFFSQVAEGGVGNDSILGGKFLGHGEYDPDDGFVYESLSGGDGDDEITGGPGNPEFPEIVEHLSGGAGDDVLDGRGGKNTNDGGADEDTCVNPGPGEPGATNCES